MHKCVICHWLIEVDDVEIAGANGACVCLRCYARLVENEKPMPKGLRRELTICMAQAA